jgi:penicillin-binding protein 2
MRRSRRPAPIITETGQAGMFSRRAVIIGGAQGTLAAILAARMGYIAIAENQRYAKLAEENRVQERLIAPRRGCAPRLDRRPLRPADGGQPLGL